MLYTVNVLHISCSPQRFYSNTGSKIQFVTHTDKHMYIRAMYKIRLSLKHTSYQHHKKVHCPRCARFCVN